MRKSRFSEEQIVRIIQEYAAGAKVSELCRKHGMSDATFYKWKAKYGGLQVSDIRRLKDLEAENGKLKKLLAETMLDNAGLKGLLAKNFRRLHTAGKLSLFFAVTISFQNGVPVGWSGFQDRAMATDQGRIGMRGCASG